MVKSFEQILYSKQGLKEQNTKEIQKTIASKQTTRKKILRQRKCKKRNNLKSTVKEKSTVKAINLTDKNENLKKATYAEILWANKAPTRRLSKASTVNHNNKLNIREKLRSISPINRYRRQGNSPSKKLSNSNIKNGNKYERKMNKLQEENWNIHKKY